MRFMILRKADEDTEAGAPPGEELIAAMGAYMGSLLKAGVLLAADGLQPTSKGARVTFSGGRPTVTDGPFAEAKELVAGWALIQATSREEAVEWAKRWPPEDGGGKVELEVRQVFEPGDFGEDFAHQRPEGRERMRAQAAARQQR
ncbi:MAG: YciI family protein [Actinomycetota bacterium]